MGTTQQILAGLTVVDLTQNVAGPFCTQTLGDLGANVIKIERPGTGDDTRAWIPPAVGDQSATYVALNRNKSSICIDVDTPAGRRVIGDLVGRADIFVHSMKPGSAERRELGWEQLRALNPKLIYCAISAFGSIGPLSRQPGYDPLMQAFTGVMSTTGNEGEDPVRVGVSLIDVGTGMWSVIGILAALVRRSASGSGSQVETSLLETGVGWMSIFVSSFAATGQIPRKMGSAMVMTAPYELFRARDGHVFIAAGNDRLFDRVCCALGRPQLADDVRYSTNTNRVLNRDTLHEELEQLTRARTVQDTVCVLRDMGAPCSELNSVEQMVSHEQVQALGVIQPISVSGGLTHRVVAMPLRIDGARSARLESAPLLDADATRILSDLGYDDDHIRQLRESGAFGNR